MCTREHIGQRYLQRFDFFCYRHATYTGRNPTRMLRSLEWHLSYVCIWYSHSSEHLASFDGISGSVPAQEDITDGFDYSTVAYTRPRGHVGHRHHYYGSSRTTHRISPTEVDAAGNLVLPTYINGHIHLDKCFLQDTMCPNKDYTFSECLELTCPRDAQRDKLK
jgi:hypothetical protein